MEKKNWNFNYYALFIILIQMMIVFFLTGRLEDNPYFRGLLIFLILFIGHYFMHLSAQYKNKSG